MADQKIEDMALAAAVIAGMQIETDIGGITANKINISQLVTYFNANLTFAGVSHAHDITDINDIIANRLLGSNGAGDVVEITLGSGVTLVAGVLSATGVSNTITKAVFVAPGDFTPGSTTTLILPIDAVIEDNLEVYFDGLFQESTEWTITTGGSPSVDFSSAIPVGVARVEVRVFN